MEPLTKGLASAAIAYISHYAFVKAYSAFCVPDGLWGFVQGAITAGSPVCQAGLSVVTNTQITYGTVITMGLTRLLLDVVAPQASSTGATPK